MGQTIETLDLIDAQGPSIVMHVTLHEVLG